MKRVLSDCLLKLYEVAGAPLVKTRLGRSLFEFSYGIYKRTYEAGDVQALASLVPANTVVIDIGANVGFFTRRFAKWVRGSGKVIAIEPEEVNFTRLARMLRQRGLLAVVEPIQGLVAEVTETLRLQVNPLHPGDHKIGSSGVPVQAYTLDDLLDQRGWPKVSLIKIDVQGAEQRVLNGAIRTLERFHPCLFIEVDDEALKRMGSSAPAVIGFMKSCGYTLHRLHKGRITQPLKLTDVLALCSNGQYADFLFLSSEQAFLLNDISERR
jgi:FkbM family methyltransferase